MQNITLAFTTYKSSNYIYKQLERDYFRRSDNIINEIVIQDDHSKDFEELTDVVKTDTRIKIYQNSKNLSPLLSRQNLVKNCTNEVIFLMDSDNYLDETIFKILKNITIDKDIIYCPDFARPNFNFKHFGDETVDIEFVKNRLDNLDMQIFLNTGNYLIHKTPYLEVGKAINTSFAYFTVDVVYFNYLWLKAGKRLFCVKDFEYDHTMRSDSYYMTDSYKSADKLKEVMELYNSL